MCNDSISQMYYLAQTAIQDLHMSVREYAALQNSDGSFINKEILSVLTTT